MLGLGTGKTVQTVKRQKNYIKAQYNPKPCIAILVGVRACVCVLFFPFVAKARMTPLPNTLLIGQCPVCEHFICALYFFFCLFFFYGLVVAVVAFAFLQDFPRCCLFWCTQISLLVALQASPPPFRTKQDAERG